MSYDDQDDVLRWAELDEVMEIVLSLKPKMHALNRWFYTKRSPADADELLIDTWLLVHNARSDGGPVSEGKFAWEPINQIAMQAFKMRETLQDKHSSTTRLEQQFMELRQYALKLEKAVVRQHYLLDTGRIATDIGTISWASKILKKSEITVRRYINVKKIWAFQVTKFWWIPIEELKLLLGGGDGDE
ncbi:hypothetical protein [Cohnella soli]|uniref:Sigma-70 family RNA polymerase sigma factor n=1 Tax=Cohnella soli TaxID=425005 RepID=A0ABW0HPM8_9BACL